MKILDLNATDRIKKLREYYLKEEPRVRRLIGDNRKHRARYLYLEGWSKIKDTAPTTRIRKSMAEAYMLKNTVPHITRGELIVGQPDLREFAPEEQAQYGQYMYAYKFVPENWGRKDHTGLDYELLLDKGVLGMLQIVEEKLSVINPTNGADAESYEFFLCCKIELEGLVTLCENYQKSVLDMLQTADKDKNELSELYETLKQVPLHPARTFREALQSVQLFTYNLYGLYSFGKPDLYLLPYYKKDIESGVLTLEKAQELIDCFFLQSVFNVPGWAAEGLMLGGYDKDGNLVENDLTYHFLKAIEHTRLPDPNIGFCVTKSTSDELLNYAASLLAKGYTQPQIWNTDAVVESMVNNGFAIEDSRLFTLSTCVEVTPIGCSGINVTSPMINVLKIFLECFHQCDDSMSFDDIFNLFARKFKAYCHEQVALENLYYLEQARNSTDPVRCSLLIHDCIEKGLSHDSGGARYNQLEPDLFGVQNVGECFNVINQLVFVEKKITIEKFKTALKSNYSGYEKLLSYIKQKVNHFGNDGVVQNVIMKRVADLMLECFSGISTARGSNILPGMFSYLYHVPHGEETDASPDGRLAGEPLNDGCNPVQGYDISGPTASLLSTAFWEPSRFLGGTSVNVKLNSGTKPETITALIKGYLGTKGAMLQFNVVDTETLKQAQKDPQKYSDVLVRVGGYSDFFVKLDRSQQDEVISRTENKM